MNTLEQELKKLIIESLALEDVAPDDIDSKANLFGEDGCLGLDSIDALELGIALQKKYKIKVDADDEQTRTYFASVNQLAIFVKEQIS